MRSYVWLAIFLMYGMIGAGTGIATSTWQVKPPLVSQIIFGAIWPVVLSALIVANLAP